MQLRNYAGYVDGWMSSFGMSRVESPNGMESAFYLKWSHELGLSSTKLNFFISFPKYGSGKSTVAYLVFRHIKNNLVFTPSRVIP